jgi:hypothetical protein
MILLWEDFLLIPHRKEVKQDEEGFKREGVGQRGCFLGQFQKSRKGKSRQGMPEVKRLKKLMLPVRQHKFLKQIWQFFPNAISVCFTYCLFRRQRPSVGAGLDSGQIPSLTRLDRPGRTFYPGMPLSITFI